METVGSDGDCGKPGIFYEYYLKTQVGNCIFKNVKYPSLKILALTFYDTAKVSRTCLLTRYRLWAAILQPVVYGVSSLIN